MFSWTFDCDYDKAQKKRALERHIFAYKKINACSNLDASEKEKLLEVYKRDIRHSILPPREGDNGRAKIGGSRIWINSDLLDSGSDNELAQTIIHEMMHCAGYRHPEKKPTDTPLDNGPYYGSPPLRAEICINGTQSLEKN
ncbi:hypothetical protein COJ70_24365 [Priestia megaterium]|uniref:hypothetical protein n=1 Tax=Priestia megaterium TaxID=1404 RepID=UPI000BF5B287|nr:hypothetical protein [Priestia megaterium]PFO12706.1 hypothetical protein COJ70_24365 [Priestia megaterium]